MFLRRTFGLWHLTGQSMRTDHSMTIPTIWGSFPLMAIHERGRYFSTPPSKKAKRGLRSRTPHEIQPKKRPERETRKSEEGEEKDRKSKEEEKEEKEEAKENEASSSSSSSSSSTTTLEEYKQYEEDMKFIKLNSVHEILPKEPLAPLPPNPSGDPFEGLSEANPLTMDPARCPEEVRWIVIQMQKDYQRLAPYEEEFKNTTIFKDFDAEVSARLDEVHLKWFEDPQAPNRTNTARLHAEHDRVYDEVYDKHQRQALKDPEKLKEFMAMKFVQDELVKLQKEKETATPTLKTIMADEPNPLRPTLTHEIHRLIRDTLRDD